MVIAQRRPDQIADMNPPCNCVPSQTTTKETLKETSAPTQPKLTDIQEKLNGIDGVKDWSALSTKPNTVVYDSYYERCICWHEVVDPTRFWEPPKRVSNL